MPDSLQNTDNWMDEKINDQETPHNHSDTAGGTQSEQLYFARQLQTSSVGFSSTVVKLKDKFVIPTRQAFRAALWGYCSITNSIPRDWMPDTHEHAEVELSGLSLGMTEEEVVQAIGQPCSRTPQDPELKARGFGYGESKWLRFINGHLVWWSGDVVTIDGREVLRSRQLESEIPALLKVEETEQLWGGGRRLYSPAHDLQLDVSKEGRVLGIDHGFRLLMSAREPRISGQELFELLKSELSCFNEQNGVDSIRKHLIEPYSELREWDYDHREEPIKDHEYWIVAMLPNPKLAIAYTRDAFGGLTIPAPWGVVPVVADGFDQDSLWSETLEDVWRRFGPRW